MNKSELSLTNILGQEQLRTSLLMLARSEANHGLLFLGAKGSGKHSLARAYAKYLLCSEPTAHDSCGTCPSCRYFAADQHPDFKEVDRDEEKLIKIERVRKEILADLNFLPQISERKVYLLTIDALNEQGQNAVLKSLEEPPAQTVFLLCAEQLDGLLDTILSRVQILKLAPLSYPCLCEALQARGYPLATAQLYASLAGGLLGKALSLAEDEDYGNLRQESLALFWHLNTESTARLLTVNLQFLLEHKDYFPQILEIWQTAGRDLAFLLLDPSAKRILNQDKKAELQQLLSQLQQKVKLTPTPSLAERLSNLQATLRSLRRAYSLNASFEGLAAQCLLQVAEQLGG